jgi:hypothetical protein
MPIKSVFCENRGTSNIIRFGPSPYTMVSSRTNLMIAAALCCTFCTSMDGEDQSVNLIQRYYLSHTPLSNCRKLKSSVWVASNDITSIYNFIKNW